MATTYATQSDVEAYIEGWVTDDVAALGRLIERAERDLDSIVGPWFVAYTVGTHTLPTGTITVDSTYLPVRFPATGTVLVGGVAVTYTGLTVTTFTGAAGGTGDVSAGTAVIYRAASGLKFDPITLLSAPQQGALKRATCAQVEYRFTMGEQFFVQAQFRQVSGPDFSQTGTLPYIAPKAERELQGFGLLRETVAG